MLNGLKPHFLLLIIIPDHYKKQQVERFTEAEIGKGLVIRLNLFYNVEM